MVRRDFSLIVPSLTDLRHWHARTQLKGSLPRSQICPSLPRFGHCHLPAPRPALLHPALRQFRRRFRIARLVSLSHLQSRIRGGACRFRSVGRLGRPDYRSRPRADHQRAQHAHNLARIIEYRATRGLHRDKRFWFRRILLSHPQCRRQRIRKYANCERTGDDRVGMGVRLLPGPFLSALSLCNFDRSLPPFAGLTSRRVAASSIRRV